MNIVIKALRLEFIPASQDAGLLVLRLWFGLSMLLLHGWGKLTGFSDMAAKFPGFFGLGPHVELGLVTFAETVCALLLALGLFTRLSAFILVINFSVAFFVAHHGILTGEKSGEMAFVYLAGYVILLIAGGGRFALDSICCRTCQKETANATS
jgi:putative oxidoreductase